MSNKSKPKKHGLHRAEVLRDKSIGRKRKNKANNRVRQGEVQSVIKKAISDSGK